MASKADLERATETVTELFQQGEHPTDALAKSAQQHRLRPGEIHLVGCAFNAGRQLAQMSNEKTARERLASFELADIEQATRQAIGDVRTAKVASATVRVSPDYSLSPDRLKARHAPQIRPTQKSASTATPKPEKPKTVYDYAILRKEAEVAKERATAKLRETDATIASAFDYLKEGLAKQSSELYLPWSFFRDSVQELHGPLGEKLLGVLPAEKLAAVEQTGDATRVVYAPDHPAFQLAKVAISLATNRGKLVAAEKRAGEALYDAQETERRHCDDVERPPEIFQTFGNLDRPSPLKLASLLPSMAALSAVGAAGNAIRSKGDAKVNSTMQKLEDVEHRNSLQNVGVSSFLTDAMTDQDSPLGHADPQDVLHVWNRAAQYAPAVAASRPELLRPYMQRMLTSDLEPFDMQQLLAVDRDVRGTSGFNYSRQTQPQQPRA